MKIKVMYRAQCLAAALGYGPEYDAEKHRRTYAHHFDFQH